MNLPPPLQSHTGGDTENLGTGGKYQKPAHFATTLHHVASGRKQKRQREFIHKVKI